MKPPYPSDLEAKGWSLDLDYERIDQSDTWAIASAEQRPWLLMLWLVSWRQVPVASLPDNHKLIAARLCMPLEQFEQWADVLLSGWEKAEDGRLYHKTLTQHVLRMAAKRDKDRARVASFRAKQEKIRVSPAELDESNGAVTRYTTATNDEPTRDQHVSSTPTPTPTVIHSVPNGTDVPSVAVLEVTPDAIFGTGLEYLKRCGVPERSARSFLGKFRKTAGDLEAAELLSKAEQLGISDPQAWLRASWQHRSRDGRSKGVGVVL